MRKILIVVFAIAFLAACQSNTKKAESKKNETTQVVDYETMEFTVTGMTCTGCENTIKNGLKQIDGVVEVEASHTNNKVSIKVEKDKVNRDEIAQQIESIGYNVEK